MKAIFFIFPISLGIAICTAIILYNYQFTNMIQGRHLLIASQIANIRSGPDTGYEIIKRLKTGELLVADGIAYSPDNNPWIRIKLYGEVEKIGYISAKLLTYANGNPILPYGCITKDKVKLITAQNAIYLHKDQIVKIVSLSLNNQKHLLFKIVTSTNKTGYIGSGALKFYPYYLTDIQFYTSLTLSIAATLIICIFIFLYQKRSLIDGNNSGHNIDNQSIILHSSNWGSHIFLCVGGLIFIGSIWIPDC